MGGKASIAEIAEALGGIDVDHVTPYIYSLLYHKELFADLRAPLTQDTVIGISNRVGLYPPPTAESITWLKDGRVSIRPLEAEGCDYPSNLSDSPGSAGEGTASMKRQSRYLPDHRWVKCPE